MYPKCYIIFHKFTPSRSVYDATGMILAILYKEMPLMHPAKYQPNRQGCSAEEILLMVFTIYGHGGHLEFRIKTILALFRFPNPWRLHRNLVTFGPVVLEKKTIESMGSSKPKKNFFCCWCCCFYFHLFIFLFIYLFYFFLLFLFSQTKKRKKYGEDQ